MAALDFIVELAAALTFPCRELQELLFELADAVLYGCIYLGFSSYTGQLWLAVLSSAFAAQACCCRCCCGCWCCNCVLVLVAIETYLISVWLYLLLNMHLELLNCLPCEWSAGCCLCSWPAWLALVLWICASRGTNKTNGNCLRLDDHHRSLHYHCNHNHLLMTGWKATNSAAAFTVLVVGLFCCLFVA